MTVVIGTAGHIDHGKTTLLRALTGIDADRLPEERRRGMTIDVGYAHMALPDGGELDFVDVPGHDRLVGNMLVGAGEIDAAMLVVAADDGPRAQTLEHLALLDALGIRHGLAVVTKADLAGPERTSEVVAAVGRLLGGTSLAGVPVFEVSSLDGRGIDALRVALASVRDRAAGSAAARTGGGSRLAIDRVFLVKGRGAVVTGTLRGAPLARGATMRLVPGDRSVRIREIQVHGSEVAIAATGRTALNVAGVESDDLHRGSVLTDDASVVGSDRLLVALAMPLPDRARARVHLGTAATDTVVGRSGRDALDLADGTFAAILRLSSPLAVAAGDRLVLRRTSGADRIVGAAVLDVAPPRGVSRRRQSSERVGALAVALAAGDDPGLAAARVELHGATEVPVRADGARGPGTGPGARPGATRVDVAPDVAEAVDAAILAAVGTGATLTVARAVAAQALRRTATIGRAAATSASVVAVDRLVAEDRLIRDGVEVRLPGSVAAVVAAEDPVLAAAMDRLERAIAMAAPPALAEAARATGCTPTGIRDLERRGRIVILEPDLAYAASTYREIAARAVAMATVTPLTPAAFRDETGTSRRYVMAILADLDRRGILRRTPDGHVPGPRASVGIPASGPAVAEGVAGSVDGSPPR